jgi:hypothetical protein
LKALVQKELGRHCLLLRRPQRRLRLLHPDLLLLHHDLLLLLQLLLLLLVRHLVLLFTLQGCCTAQLIDMLKQLHCNRPVLHRQLKLLNICKPPAAAIVGQGLELLANLHKQQGM